MNMKFGVLAGSIIAVMMGLSGQAMAGSDEEQLARMKDPDQWPAPGRDFSLTRHSDLADINTKNIGKLQLVWLQSQNNLRGQEGQPLVIKDVGGKTVLFMVSVPRTTEPPWHEPYASDRSLPTAPTGTHGVVKPKLPLPAKSTLKRHPVVPVLNFSITVTFGLKPSASRRD